MPIGSSLGITLPTVGASTNTWGSDLNTELNKVITAVEAQVPASAIDFSADFDLNGYAVTSAKYSSYTQQTSVSAINAFYVKTDGNFYGRDGGNNEIQFTASGALNNASAGGLGDSGGTYGTSGITFDWDGTEYNAKDGSGANDYANVVMNDLLLNDGSGNELTIAVPSMGSNYTLTLPAAVPAGATTILQANTSGTVSYSNSFSTDITLTGAAELKHGSRTKIISGLTGVGVDSAGTSPVLPDISATTKGYWEADAAGDFLLIPINLDVGDRITSIRCLSYGGNGTATARSLYFTAQSGTGAADQGSESSATAAASGYHDTTITVSPQLTVATGYNYQFMFVADDLDDRVYAIEVTYDRP